MCSFKRQMADDNIFVCKILKKMQSNLPQGVTHGKDKNWLLKTGDPLIQVHLHYILVQGTQKMWLHKTGDPLIEVTT